MTFVRDESGKRVVDLGAYRKIGVELGDFRLMVELALQGLRWGEIAGLKVLDLDFDDPPTLTVQRNRTRGRKSRMVLKDSTKSWRAKRPLALPKTLATELEAHVIGLAPDDFLFTSPDGDMLHYSNWRTRYWVPAVEAAGMKGFRFQDLKHVATKMLNRAGVSKNVKERRLGNSIEVQNAVYDKATDPEDEEAASILEKMMYQNGSEP